MLAMAAPTKARSCNNNTRRRSFEKFNLLELCELALYIINNYYVISRMYWELMADEPPLVIGWIVRGG